MRIETKTIRDTTTTRPVPGQLWQRELAAVLRIPMRGPTEISLKKTPALDPIATHGVVMAHDRPWSGRWRATCRAPPWIGQLSRMIATILARQAQGVYAHAPEAVQAASRQRDPRGRAGRINILRKHSLFFTPLSCSRAGFSASYGIIMSHGAR